MNKPKALALGDTIGLISPSSPTSPENVNKAKEKLIEMGFKVKMGKSPYEKRGYLSGSDDIRAKDIEEMFKDKEVDGILCVRGGYGTPRILDKLDYELIKNNPKVFIGYSDITALHVAFNQLANLVTFHGPMASSDMLEGFSDFSRDSLFRNVLEGEANPYDNPPGEEIITINGGKAVGTIIGGNLSLLVDTLATPYEVDTKDKLFFIEEVKEDPYNIDRMFNQLRLAGKFDDAAGIILGDFNNCESSKHEESLSLMELIDDHIKGANKPTIYNLQAGHCSPTLTLPFGVLAELDADNKELRIQEMTLSK